jgi:hypothetical protein
MRKGATPRAPGWNHPLRDIVGRTEDAVSLSCGHALAIPDGRHGKQFGKGKRARCRTCPLQEASYSEIDRRVAGRP